MQVQVRTLQPTIASSVLGELLRRRRLQLAHGLLKDNAGNVSEIAYVVG